MNFVGLPQLDLEDDREVPVVAEPREMAAGQPPEPLGRIGEVGDLGAAVGQPFTHAALEDRHQQVVLALEVQVDGAGRDAGGARDVGDLGVEVAALGEDVDGGAEDGVALGPGRRVRAGRPGSPGDGVQRHN